MASLFEDKERLAKLSAFLSGFGETVAQANQQGFGPLGAVAVGFGGGGRGLTAHLDAQARKEMAALQRQQIEISLQNQRQQQEDRRRTRSLLSGQTPVDINGGLPERDSPASAVPFTQLDPVAQAAALARTGGADPSVIITASSQRQQLDMARQNLDLTRQRVALEESRFGLAQNEDARKQAEFDLGVGNIEAFRTGLDNLDPNDRVGLANLGLKTGQLSLAQWFDATKGDESQRALKIAGLVQRGVPINWATDVVDDNAKITEDKNGNPIIFNRATRETFSIPPAPDQFGIGGTQGTNQQAGGPVDPRTFVIDPSRLSPDTIEEAQNTVIASSNVIRAVPGVMEELAKGGVGFWSNVQAFTTAAGAPFGDTVIGRFMAAPDTAASRRAVQLFIEQALPAMIKNSRFPVAEQNRLIGMLPDPKKIFSDKAVAIREFAVFDQVINQIFENNRALLKGEIPTNIPVAPTGLTQNDPIIMNSMEELQTLPAGVYVIHPESGQLMQTAN